MSRRGWVIGALVLISLLLVSPALAPAGRHVSAQGTIGAPPEWVNFYGTNSTFNGLPLPVGAEVVAYAGDKRCGSFIVHTPGQYGVMPCYRDRPEQPGAQPGDRIRFTVNGYEAIVRGLGGYVSDPTAEDPQARSEFDTQAYEKARRAGKSGEEAL
ncbi:MAG: hypothetical protein ACP5TV_08415, partial [Anaerolineae bacterium]